MKRLLLLSALVVCTLFAAGAQGATHSTVNLTTGRVDGHRILGRTIAGVTAALGHPDFRAGRQSHYRVGWGGRPNFSIEVLFRRIDGVQRAWSIAFERGPVTDAKLGELLSRKSLALQKSVLARYGDTFKLVRPYACNARMCVGELAPLPGARVHFTFGTRPTFGTWLTLWQVSL